MTNNLKAGSNRRGRPPGSGIDDAATLIAVADLLAAEPGLKPTSAMKRTVKKIGISQLRRLQVKWKQDCTVLLAAAQQRQKQRQAAQSKPRRMAAVSSSQPYTSVAAALGASLQHATAATSPLMMEQARMAGCFGSQNLTGTGALHQLISHTTEQNKLYALASGLSPTLQTIGALAEPGWMKHIRKMTEQQERLSRLINPLKRFGL